MHTQEGAGSIVRAIEQSLELQLLDGGFQSLDLRDYFTPSRFVLVEHLDQALKVVRRADSSLERDRHAAHALQFPNCALGLFLVVPEITGRHLVFDGLNAC